MLSPACKSYPEEFLSREVGYSPTAPALGTNISCAREGGFMVVQRVASGCVQALGFLRCAVPCNFCDHVIWWGGGEGGRDEMLFKELTRVNEKMVLQPSDSL